MRATPYSERRLAYRFLSSFTRVVEVLTRRRDCVNGPNLENRLGYIGAYATINAMGTNADRPRLVDVSHLGFSVTDLDRSIRFYCDVLGAALVRAPDSGESPSFFGREAVVFLGAHALDLFEHAGNTGERFGPARTGLDHLALAAESSEHLHKWALWLDSCDVPRSAIREAGGVGELFDFVDPDGIQLEFFFLDPEKLQKSAVYSDFA